MSAFVEMYGQSDLASNIALLASLAPLTELDSSCNALVDLRNLLCPLRVVCTCLSSLSRMRANFSHLVAWNFSWFAKQNKRKAVTSWYNAHLFQHPVAFEGLSHLNILSNCRLPCCDIYIYLYMHIVVSMPGYTCSVFRSHFWRSLLLLLLMCSCFCFFNAHLWDLGTPKMDGKMGKVLLHITGSEAWLKLPAPEMCMPLNSRISHLVHPGYCGESIVSKVDSQKG